MQGRFSAGPYTYVLRKLFWVAFTLGLIAVPHGAVMFVYLVILKRPRMPPMLAFPRPEIFVLQMTLPVSMQCVASLFAMHRWQPIVYGVLLLLAIPLPIVAGVVKAVWDTQVKVHAVDRKFYYLVDRLKLREAALRRRWYTAWLGPFRGLPRGEWVASDESGERYLARWGQLFDNLIGPLVVRVGDDYRFLPSLSRFNRGTLVPFIPGKYKDARDVLERRRARWIMSGYLRVLMVSVQALLTFGLVLALAVIPTTTSTAVSQSTGMTVVQAILTWVLMTVHPYIKLGDQASFALGAVSAGFTYLLLIAANGVAASANAKYRMAAGLVLGRLLLFTIFLGVAVFAFSQLWSVWSFIAWIRDMVNDLLESRGRKKHFETTADQAALEVSYIICEI